MGRKPEAGGAKGKAEAAKVRMTDPEQSARFLEAAREAGVDETGKAFERAFGRIALPKRPESGGSRKVHSTPKQKRKK